MKHPTQSITNLPLSPDEERRHRAIKYSVAMGIRVLCIIVIPFCPGMWWLIPAVGAVFLPYFAVVIANVSPDPRKVDVQRPGNILPVTTPTTPPSPQPPPPAPDAEPQDETKGDDE
ncbi:MAG: DUF3099 domain-containing protein [Actinomycetales bacterium]